MARSPITWRNVTGASAGNPSSSMGTAISGFGMAGRGALDQIESLRKGEEIKNAELTQRTIADVMASGKPLDATQLGNFAPGVDTSQVLEAVLGAEANKAQTAFNIERTETEAYENDPLTIQRKREQENRLASLQERTLAIRNSELQAQLEARKAPIADRENATKLDLGWDNYKTAGLQPKEQEVQAAIGQIQNDPNISEQEKITAIDALNQELNIYRNEWETENLNNYLADAYKNNPGMSATAINASRAGQLQSQLNARATKLAEQRQEADIDYRKRQDIRLKEMAGGIKLYGMAFDSNGQPVIVEGNAKDNQMNKSELYEIVRSKGTDFLGNSKDDEIPKIAKERLDALWATLDGNRSVLTSLMNNVNWKYDTEWLFGTTDEVHNLPPLQDAQEAALKLQQAAAILHENNAKAGRPTDKPMSQIDQKLAKLKEEQLRRGQQAVQQQYSLPELNNAGLAQELQNAITRLSAPKIGAPDPRLLR